MKTIIGIDVGGSTTKIVAFAGDRMITPQFVKASDPLTSLYGAFGKFTAENGIALPDVEKVVLTGVGSSHLQQPLYALPCKTVSEFDCVAHGGLYLSGLSEAIVVSMGTGTAVVHAKKEAGTVATKYLGGTGVGGGTLMGLCKKELRLEEIGSIVTLAQGGDLSKVDLQVGDIASPESHIGLSPNLTASNFGKLSDLATGADIALAIINMVFETAFMLSVFAARGAGIRDIVFTGNLTSIPQARPIIEKLASQFDVRAVIPDNSQYATAIGAAILK